MTNLSTRIKRVEEKLGQRTAAKDLDMRVEFYSCSLGPNCPLRKYQTGDFFNLEGVLIKDGQCQHRFRDDLSSDLRKKYGIYN